MTAMKNVQGTLNEPFRQRCFELPKTCAGGEDSAAVEGDSFSGERKRITEQW